MGKEYEKKLPKSFVKNVNRVCGEKGEAWLTNLPLIISTLKTKWKISVSDNFSNLSYNYVAPAVLEDGSLAVLKIGLPVDDKEIYSEAACLRHLDGDGTVRLLAEDRDSMALLIERAVPGHDLKQIFEKDPAQSVSVAIAALKRIVRDPPRDQSELVDFRYWYRRLNDAEGNEFPYSYAAKALKIFESSTADKPKLIHGDFHHANILSCGRNAFTAIDPKGVIGDVRYDIAVFLKNHYGWLARRKAARDDLESAVIKFADAFAISPEGIRQWGFAQMVLSSYWTFTEGGAFWRKGLASADIWDV